MAESLKERQAKLAERLKTETPKTPLQEVNPVTEADRPASKISTTTTEDNLVQFNVKVPKSMAKAVRQAALDEDKEIRDIVQEAIRSYLQQRKTA